MLETLAHPRQFRDWCNTYPEAIAAALCALLTLTGWLALLGSWLGLGIGLLLAAYGIGGYGSARDGLMTLWQERDLDVDLLMIVAALGAALLGFWQQTYSLLVDGAVLILIFALSGALESIAMQRTERNVRSLMALTPDQARRLQPGQEVMVATQDLAVGDRLLIKPGERIPTDGLIQSGYSTVNQAAITGESLPVDKGPGDEVFGGTLNGSGALVIELHKSPASSTLQRVIQLVEQAKRTRPPSQRFLERFERGYARVIVIAGLGLITLPPGLLGWDWQTTIYRALVFLVVASPCALMAAIMPTLLSGIACGARQGILFKDGGQLETLGRVRAIAFDKTGTLTTGQLQVTQVLPAPAVDRTTVLQVAASLEAYSEHPVARAVLQAATAEAIALLPVADVQAQVGQGLRGRLDHQTIVLGNTGFALPGIPLDPSLTTASQTLEAQGQTIIWVLREQQVLGLIALADRVRPEAASLVAALKRLGVTCTVMLTGDNPITAQTVAASVGVDTTYANLLPADKVAILQRLQRQYQTVAMVGDGINDAPALAQASVGIAMGGAGSDVALETADIVLMADRLDKLEAAIRLGRRSQGIVRQNITLALASVAVLLIANFWGELSLPAGVLGHEGSTLLVTLNGLRLLRA